MPSKRDVLAQLSREELISVVERFGLEVADRRKKDDLFEAVASSRKATLADVLPDLSRERLKELCVALGLDDGGREKATLIERLAGTGKEAAESPKPEPTAKGNGASKGSATTTIDLAPGEKLTRRALRAGFSPGRGEAGRTAPKGVPWARGVVYERIYAQNSGLCGGLFEVPEILGF
jgi:hypothetical protein